MPNATHPNYRIYSHPDVTLVYVSRDHGREVYAVDGGKLTVRMRGDSARTAVPVTDQDVIFEILQVLAASTQ